jgi:hypothetical protein
LFAFLEDGVDLADEFGEAGGVVLVRGQSAKAGEAFLIAFTHGSHRAEYTLGGAMNDAPKRAIRKKAPAMARERI